MRSRFPNAASLEEAYFAATDGIEGTVHPDEPQQGEPQQDETGVAINPVIYSIADFQSGALLT